MTLSRQQHSLLLIATWCAVSWLMAFCLTPATLASASILDSTPLAPETEQNVLVAMKILRHLPSPDTAAAVDTLLGVRPSVAVSMGRGPVYGSTDPAAKQALEWLQKLQPADVLADCLEKGSDRVINWALRQIVWKRAHGWFAPASLPRLKAGVAKALEEALPATRAQAVRTMVLFHPDNVEPKFLKPLLQDPSDEVAAAALTCLTRSNSEVDALVTAWLQTSDNSTLLQACCNYWSRKLRHSSSSPPEEVIDAFERLSQHRDLKVRRAVAYAIENAATPAQPRLVGILLRLTYDKYPKGEPRRLIADAHPGDAVPPGVILVAWDAVMCLRNANTPEVNARLQELFAQDQPEQIRMAAIEILGVFGKPNLPLIIEAAKNDPLPEVRWVAVYDLRLIGTPEAGLALKATQNDPDSKVSKQAKVQYGWFQKEHAVGK